MFKRFLTSCLYILRFVICVPKFAGNPQVLTTYQSCINSFFDTLANFFFIAVVRRTIQMPVRENQFPIKNTIYIVLHNDLPVTQPNCFINEISTRICRYFPTSISNGRNRFFSIGDWKEHFLHCADRESTATTKTSDVDIYLLGVLLEPLELN